MTEDVGLRNGPIPEPDPLIYLLDAEEISPELLDQFLTADQPSVGTEAATHGVAAVARARSQVGVRESGGEDRGVPYQRYVQYFGRGIPPSPWCAFFVSWCFAVSGSRPPWSNPGYVPTIYSWARTHGLLVGSPQHGDMFGVGGSHMGLVAGADANQIYTVEGNYSDQVTSRLIRWRGAGLWFARW